jgi:hypothetical protein
VKVQGVKYTPPRKCECKTLTGKAWGWKLPLPAHESVKLSLVKYPSPSLRV